MAVARQSHKIYINRDIDFTIEEYISNKTPKLLFVHAEGGFGKSTLLRKFLKYEERDVPTVLIDIKEQSNRSFVDILLDEEVTTTKHCKNFEQIKEILHKEPKLFNAIANSDTDSISAKIKELNEEYGEYAKVLLDAIKMGAKWKQKEYENKKKEILLNTEFVLLQALVKDFEKEHGLFMVDTFEKIKNSDIPSKVRFNEDGTVTISLKERHYRLKDYIENLVYLFVDNSTFIIAGRNTQDELNMEVPQAYTQELELFKFNPSNLQEFFNAFSKKNAFPTPSKEQLKTIEELTFGNPLLVHLLSEVAKQYSNWEQFDYESMKRRINEDEEHGLLFYLTDRILSHAKIKDIYKLLIPRVLTKEIAKVLFGELDVLEEIRSHGLGFKGSKDEFHRYYLHDSVHAAILNDAQQNVKEQGLSSWHDNPEVKELHQNLIAFYSEGDDIYGVNSEFEICYHTMMLREGFEDEFEVGREEFFNFTLGSLGLNLKTKKALCQNFKALGTVQIDKMIKALHNEKDRFIFSSELYSEISRALALGIIENDNDIDFLEELSRDRLKNDWSVFYSLGNAYLNKEEYDQAIEAYKKAIAINPKRDQAYNNMGIAYYHLGLFDEVIKAFTEALKINSNQSEIYTNLFELELTQNQTFDETIEKQYTTRFKEKKETLIHYEMLKVFQNIHTGQASQLEQWQENYRGVSMGDWSFDELRTWIEGMEESETKIRLLEALEVFEGHG